MGFSLPFIILDSLLLTINVHCHTNERRSEIMMQNVTLSQNTVCCISSFVICTSIRSLFYLIIIFLYRVTIVCNICTLLCISWPQTHIISRRRICWQSASPFADQCTCVLLSAPAEVHVPPPSPDKGGFHSRWFDSAFGLKPPQCLADTEMANTADCLCKRRLMDFDHAIDFTHVGSSWSTSHTLNKHTYNRLDRKILDFFMNLTLSHKKASSWVYWEAICSTDRESK